MKRLGTIFVLCLPLLWSATASAQTQSDSAAAIINKYLKNLGHDQLNWQTIDIKSVITFSSTSDTLIMERKFAFPEYSFVKISHHGKIIFGLYSDGNEFLKYDTTRLSWDVAAETDYQRLLAGYDIRGPLWNWENMSISAEYRGTSYFEGNMVRRVRVHDPLRGNREYLFEAASGNLFLTVELPGEGQAPAVDWRAIHEYTPAGPFLFPTLESYQAGGTITIIASQAELRPFATTDFPRPATIHEYY